ncbi:MAG: hypothetical protein K2I79_01675 [Clostridia bacterium]|nr:hypothetical protein [Clostridia bacterium]
MILADTVAGQGKQLAVFLALGFALGFGLWLISYCRYVFRIGNISGGIIQCAFSIAAFAVCLIVEHFVFDGEMAIFHAFTLIFMCAAVWGVMNKLTSGKKDSVRIKADKLKCKIKGSKIGKLLFR